MNKINDSFMYTQIHKKFADECNYLVQQGTQYCNNKPVSDIDFKFTFNMTCLQRLLVPDHAHL